MIKRVLLLIGICIFFLIVWHIGPERIYDAAAQLGPAALLILLIPSFVMYVIEAYAWKITLGPSAKDISFWRVFAIKTAGEVVNMTTPSGYVGGEPVKAYLLKKYHVPMVEGLASVVIAKTTKAIAEVLFILLGVLLVTWSVSDDDSLERKVLKAFLSIGLLIFGIAMFVFVQRRGLFTLALAFLRKIGLKIAYLESREEKLRLLDRTIMEYYRHHRPVVYASTGLFFLSWIVEALEVYIIILYLGQPAEFLSAVSINALSALIKGGTFFIPGSLGAQDAGNLFLLKDFGYSDVAGVTFALVRRYRELVWIGLGLLCLAMLGGRTTVMRESRMDNSGHES